MLSLSTMPYQKYLHIIVQLLIIVGAINWLTIATYNVDLVEKITMGNAMADKYIKVLVGVCGVYAAYLLLPTLMGLVRD